MHVCFKAFGAKLTEVTKEHHAKNINKLTILSSNLSKYMH